MTKIIFALVFFVLSNCTLSAQNYEQGMQKALGFWKEGKTTEAVALFERIAATENDKWIPNYYIGLIQILESFKPENKGKMNDLLNNADEVIDLELSKNPENAEFLVLQALSKTALLASDPMTYGMSLSPQISGIYQKALALAPANPRVVLNKADFEMGGAQWTGADIKQICKQYEQAVELFSKFKDETPFYPNWGLDRAKAGVLKCGQ